MCFLPYLHAESCDELKTLGIADMKITLAHTVPAGDFALSPEQVSPQTSPQGATEPFKNLPAFCRVAATIRPTADSEIKIEVWMPLSGWNGKFVAVGNGGWAGAIAYSSLASSLAKGYATASTDAGHEGDWFYATFAFGHPEKLIDYSYRAVHLMSVDAKTIVAAFYGHGPRFSYFAGCSNGGKQGLMEAQRFPADYDGILAGAPANSFTHLMFAFMWPESVTLKNPADSIPPEKYALVQKAVIKVCDALDGVADGIIEDPTQCHFDPKTIECKGQDGPNCLTPRQVDAFKQLFAGPRNPRTGEQVFPALAQGSPLELILMAEKIPETYFKYVLFKSPDWKWQSLNYDTDVAAADKSTAGVLDAVDPNLTAFKSHGGKLLIYHGWSDPYISALNSIDYYKSVVAAMGGDSETKDFARLFIVPGMEHCGGGPGPTSFDGVDVLDHWVQEGVAPERIIVSRSSDGVVDMTRPLCPYPKVARWNGEGKTNEAGSFSCVDRRK